MQMIKFHQELFCNDSALVVAVVASIRNRQIIRNSRDCARTRWTPKRRSGRRRSRRRRGDENEDDKHGDKDNEDEDDDPNMPAKSDVTSRPFRNNIVFSIRFSNTILENDEEDEVDDVDQDGGNEDDKHGDEDNDDEDDDPKMQATTRCYF